MKEYIIEENKKIIFHPRKGLLIFTFLFLIVIMLQFVAAIFQGEANIFFQKIISIVQTPILTYVFLIGLIINVLYFIIKIGIGLYKKTPLFIISMDGVWCQDWKKPIKWRELKEIKEKGVQFLTFITEENRKEDLNFHMMPLTTKKTLAKIESFRKNNKV